MGYVFKDLLVLQTEAPTNTEVSYEQNAVVSKMACVYLDHSPHRACVSTDTGTHLRSLNKHKNSPPGKATCRASPTLSLTLQRLER